MAFGRKFLAWIALLTTAMIEAKEPHWGRIYLRNGLAPIQYFRDAFGGPMVHHEVQFVFPSTSEHQAGCQPLPEADQNLLKALNGTGVLVVDRGDCTFEAKARNAQAMGASALVIISITDDVKAPVAIVDQGEIDIASVMIRRSAGDLLRAIPSPVFGRLMPMQCEKNPYRCAPAKEMEKQYIATMTARSGTIQTPGSQVVGEFLTSNYGSVLPTTHSIAISAPVDACQLISERLEGKLALITLSAGCSMLQKVSNAQAAGARMALVELPPSVSTMLQPTVEKSWQAYNITIAAGVISSATMETLQTLSSVKLERDNAIADAWEAIHKLSVKSAWPNRSTRREQLVQQLLSTLSMDAERTTALRNVFMNVGGGNKASWDRVMGDIETEDEGDQTNMHEDL